MEEDTNTNIKTSIISSTEEECKKREREQEKLKKAKFARTQEGELYRIVGMYDRKDNIYDMCFQLKELNDNTCSSNDSYFEEYESRLEIGEELVDLLHSSDTVELTYTTIYGEKAENIFIVVNSENMLFLFSSDADFSYSKTKKKWRSYKQSKVLDIISIMPYEKYKNDSYIIKESKDNEQSK